MLGIGSTGRIAEQIGEAAVARGHSSFIAYGRQSRPAASNSYRVGGLINTLMHGCESFVADRQGLSSRRATKKLVMWLQKQKPDAVGLHNLHGYYLNYPELFRFLRSEEVPVLWTLHDCWPFTGHCAHYGRFACTKWRHTCQECPMTHYYPRSLTDFSKRNFERKQEAFGGLKNLKIITPSVWLKKEVEQSFLSEYSVSVVHNGVDINRFRPGERSSRAPILLGVANVWTDQKGLSDIGKLRQAIPSSFRIVLIGVSQVQKSRLPVGVEGVAKIKEATDLARWYQRASVFVNPTYNDNFPTTNIEALACGTPVVTYNTGGCAEAVDSHTGFVVEPGDIRSLAVAVQRYVKYVDPNVHTACRRRAVQLFNKLDRFSEYVDVYESFQNDLSTSVV